MNQQAPGHMFLGGRLLLASVSLLTQRVMRCPVDIPTSWVLFKRLHGFDVNCASMCHGSCKGVGGSHRGIRAGRIQASARLEEAGSAVLGRGPHGTPGKGTPATSCIERLVCLCSRCGRRSTWTDPTTAWSTGALPDCHEASCPCLPGQESSLHAGRGPETEALSERIDVPSLRGSHASASKAAEDITGVLQVGTAVPAPESQEKDRPRSCRTLWHTCDWSFVKTLLSCEC